VNLAIYLRRLSFAALALLLLAAGGLFVAPYFVSDQEARLAAMRALRAATGVEPQIAGTMRFTLLPVPAVHIYEVQLDNGQSPVFRADSLRANLQLLPLLYGRVEIASLAFENAHLTIDAADAAIGASLPLRRTDGQNAGEVPEIRFVNGTVYFKDGAADYIEPLANVDAALARSGAGVTATGSFRWRGQPMTMSLSVNNIGVLAKGERSGIRIRLESDTAKLGFEGGIAYRNGIQADGAIAAEADSLRAAILQFAGTTRLTRGGFGPFKLKAHAAVAANSLSLSKLSVELDGNRADGGVTIKRDGARTVAQATLASDSADFTPYSSGFSMVDDDGADWSREPIDFSGLEATDLDVRFSASRIVVRKTELTRVAAIASIRSGELTVSVGEAQFHGGVLRGQALFGHDPGGDPHIRIEGNVADFNLAPGFAALANIQGLEGKGTLALALEGSGPHMHALMRALSGTATLTSAGGAIAGVNVEQVLRRLERNPLSGIKNPGGGRTAFDNLSAKLRVTNGTARVEEAQVESPQVRLNLSGEASVVYRDFNLRGTAMLRPGDAANPASLFEVPFLVRGPWNNPYLMPDPLPLIRRSGGTGSAYLVAGDFAGAASR
jgi:AsmA protein